MFNKKNLISMALVGISVFSFYTMTSCSGVSYEIMIPKILPDQEEKIKEEVRKESLIVWEDRRKYFKPEQWILTKNLDGITTGYISGGRVEIANFSSININVVKNEIWFTMKVEPNKKIRFIGNKIELVLKIAITLPKIK